MKHPTYMLNYRPSNLSVTWNEPLQSYCIWVSSRLQDYLLFRATLYDCFSNNQDLDNPSRSLLVVSRNCLRKTRLFFQKGMLLLWKLIRSISFTWPQALKCTLKEDQVENSETSELLEISEIFFQESKIRVFNFVYRAKSITRNNFSEISHFSKLSICDFFIFHNFFFQYSKA